MDIVDPQEVLSFWLGELDAQGLAARERRERWFKAEAELDAEIRSRFLSTYEALAAGRLETWLDEPRSRLSAVIVLDQLARNMFRGTPRMFEADSRALAIASKSIELGDEASLRTQERTFLYMPFMHSEALSDQERCVELFAALRDELDEPARGLVENNHHFAVLHRDIIAEWGRFPHRNAVLGRVSTAAELAFLETPGSSF